MAPGSLVLRRPLIVSAKALSSKSPTLPAEGSTPASARRSAHQMAESYNLRRLRRPFELGVVDEAAALGRPALVERLFQSVQDEAGGGGAQHPPADDAAGKGVVDEGDVDEALPRVAPFRPMRRISRATRAARHVAALPPQRPPHFPHPIDLDVLVDGASGSTLPIGPTMEDVNLFTDTTVETLRRVYRQHAPDMHGRVLKARRRG